jgi:hypothetical protein
LKLSMSFILDSAPSLPDRPALFANATEPLPRARRRQVVDLVYFLRSNVRVSLICMGRVELLCQDIAFIYLQHYRWEI